MCLHGGQSGPAFLGTQQACRSGWVQVWVGGSLGAMGLNGSSALVSSPSSSVALEEQGLHLCPPGLLASHLPADPPTVSGCRFLGWLPPPPNSGFVLSFYFCPVYDATRITVSFSQPPACSEFRTVPLFWPLRRLCGIVPCRTPPRRFLQCWHRVLNGTILSL